MSERGEGVAEGDKLAAAALVAWKDKKPKHKGRGGGVEKIKKKTKL